MRAGQSPARAGDTSPPEAASSARISAYWSGDGQDRDAVVVLGRGPHHRRAADVDLLDELVVADAALGEVGLERVEVDATRSIPSIPDAAMSAWSSGRCSRAGCPWIFGCRVLTRPPRISGWPVTCSTRSPGRRCPRSPSPCLRVERISTPMSEPAHSASSPVLSDTEISARRIFDRLPSSRIWTLRGDWGSRRRGRR